MLKIIVAANVIAATIKVYIAIVVMPYSLEDF